jgi:translocon-associated protein subunit beta
MAAMARLFLTPVLLLALFLSAAAADTAFLLVHKKASLQRLNKDAERVKVGITAHNAGSSTAYDITLNDDTWPAALFSVLSGNTSTSWDKLEAGGVVSHSFVLEARSKGVFTGPPAVVKYRVSSKSALQEAFSTPLPGLDILSDKPIKKYDWAKKFAVKYGPLMVVLSIVGLFIYLLVSPSKSRKFSKVSKKRK